MQNAKIIKPSEENLNSYLAACREYKERGILGDNLHDPDEFHIWGPGLIERYEMMSQGQGLKEGYVPATSYWLVEGGEFVAEGSIRHQLTPPLVRYGGHIGYAVRATKWGLGYGTLLLSLLLKEAADMGIESALLTCNEENIGSARVMVKNGGEYIDTVDNNVGGKAIRTRRYIIPTAPHNGCLMSGGAHLYDMDMSVRQADMEDIPFYKTLAKKKGSRVLELGCGTGRVAISLAQEGYSVWGLDLSPRMLDLFRKKRGLLPLDVQERLHICHGSMSGFDLNQRFDLIIAPNRAFQALTADLDISSCLEAVSGHLAVDGVFTLNAFKPYGRLDESWITPRRLVWERIEPGTGKHVAKYESRDAINPDRQTIQTTISFEETETDGRTETFTDRYTLRYYYYEQLRKLLINHHFNVVNEYGWYDFSPINDNKELIFLCKN